MIYYLAAMALVVVGVYAVVTKENLIKKMIGLSIFTNGIHLFLMALGFRSAGVAPIMTFPDPVLFSLVSVDPLPQALVLTSIVINLSVTALAMSMIIKAYKLFGTVDTRKLKVMKG
jgi:multicomponent Na+:H+ antiporter subunit C